MSKIVTLRLSEQLYRLFRFCAEADNRPLSNFIETAAQRYLEEGGFVDEFEMKEIRTNKALTQGIEQGHEDARRKRGRFAG